MAKKQKKIRKGVVRGIAHIKATHNNTMITVTDTNGETLAWDSAGTIGFKGARKSTPFAATRAGEQCGQKVRKMGMNCVAAGAHFGAVDVVAVVDDGDVADHGAAFFSEDVEFFAE